MTNIGCGRRTGLPRVLAGGALVVAAVCGTAQAPAPGGPGRMPPQVPSVRDEGPAPAVAGLAYGTASAAQKLDLYRPAVGSGPFPVLVYIHGGGFRVGSRSMASAALVRAALAAGHAVASIDYRLSGEAPFPAAVQDVFAAVAFLKTQAAVLRLDASRLAVYGESAGANLASLLGTAFRDPVFRAGVQPPGLDVRPDRVVAHYPPVDFLRLDELLAAQGCDAASVDHDRADSFESRYLGGPIQSVPGRAAAANPITYVSADAPPFFIQNGDRDCFVGSAQGALLAAALRKAGVATVYYELLPGADHGGPPFETARNLDKIVAFLAGR